MFWTEGQMDKSWLVLKRIGQGSPQPSQQQIGREVESRRKDLWRTPFPNEVNPHDIHWEATTFFKEFISAKNCQRALKVKETGENKRRLSESQTSRSRKQVDKTSQLPGMWCRERVNKLVWQISLPSGRDTTGEVQTCQSRMGLAEKLDTSTAHGIMGQEI